jgi:predicted CopG family antitoxin
MYAISNMASKTVALDTEAYELLRRQKREEESFSDAVKRLARPRRPITSFGGMWKDMSEKERKELDLTYSKLHDADRRRAERLRKS